MARTIEQIMAEYGVDEAFARQLAETGAEAEETSQALVPQPMRPPTPRPGVLGVVDRLPSVGEVHAKRASFGYITKASQVDPMGRDRRRNRRDDYVVEEITSTARELE